MKKVNPNNFFLVLLLSSVIFYCVLIIFYNRDQVTGLIAPKPPEPTAEVSDIRTLSGILKKITPPPADEIGYKYVLELDKKFQTTNDELLIGGSGLAPKTIIVTLPSDTSTTDFLKLLNKHVALTGQVKWGYAESKYIEVSAFTLIK
jgi:hypothetical protein